MKSGKRTAGAAKVEKAVPSAVVQGTPAWVYWAGLAVASVAVFLVYGPSMRGPFLLDDTYLPYMLPQFADAPPAVWMRGVRPLLMLTYWMNFQSAGDQTWGYHVVNVILHVLNGGLIFLVLRRLLGWAGLEERRLDVFAGFGAAVFLLHPLQTESVSYIASRSETLSVFFFLAALAVFVYRRTVEVGWATAAAVLVLFGAACLSKEHAAVLPVLLLLTDYYWNPGFSVEGIRRNWRLYVPMFLGAALAGVFILRVLTASISAGFALKDLTWYQYFFTQCRAVWRYFLFFAIPLGQNLDHDFATSKTIFDQGAVLGLIGLVVLVALAWVFRRRFSVVSYGILVSLLLLAPTSSVVPIRDTLVERRMYLPFVGFLLIALGLLRKWKASRETLLIVFGVVIAVFAALTYSRNQLWAEPINMWQDSVSKSPAKVRPHFQLAYAQYTAQHCQEAVEQFAKTAQLEKPEYSLLVDWGLAADCAGNSVEALAKLQQAATLEQSAHIYSQIGMEYAKLKEYPEALAALEKAVKLDPNFEITYVYRGNIYSLQNERAQAAEEYRKALAINPGNQVARDGLLRVARQ